MKSIRSKIPKSLQKKGNKYNVQKNINGYEYFLKVINIRHKNEIVPLILVEEKVKKLILQKRKSDLIDNYIEELYKKELENKNIKIYN